LVGHPTPPGEHAVSATLARWTAAARRRSFIDDALFGTPLILVLAAIAWRVGGAPLAVMLSAAGLAAGLVAAFFRARRFDRIWLVRRLDTLRSDLEDSADLLFAGNALSPLQDLQRRRLEARLAATAGPDLQPAWSTRRILSAWCLSSLAFAAAWLWPHAAMMAPAAEGPPPPPGVPRLTALRLRVTPPAYTGLPARDLFSLDAQVPRGSRVEWTLHFTPEPRSAALAPPDGPGLALRRAGRDWRAALTLDRSWLYRVTPAGAPALPATPLHRLDALPDTPPKIIVLQPTHSLTEVAPGQRLWPLVFEAVDDYGVAPDARLRLTFAEGEGEQVTFRERTLLIHGTGPARRRRFAVDLDYAALGFTRGGDLVAQLMVDDNSEPTPQTTASPSLILRWSSTPDAQGEGLDGAVKTVLPAYLRSERQIIIDAEQLLRERRGLDPKRFMARSDGLGADQQGLRLRYSQFLGGENEHAENALPTDDADEAAPSATPAVPAAPSAVKTFGVEGDTLHAYGHAHDQPEADLLEPNTRAKLKAAVDQMFGAETRLRQGDPAAALPYANAALVLIKEVQQAERVFVAHTGLQPPPIDESRRLTGKRDGIERDSLTLDPAVPTDPAPAAAWRALADAPGTTGDIDLTALERWLRSDAAEGVDRLSFAADIDAVRHDPRCAACRRALRARLWTALQHPPPHVPRRAKADAAGDRYLDALGQTR
jgi:hypothetical protein